jgi:hypothetical protein
MMMNPMMGMGMNPAMMAQMMAQMQQGGMGGGMSGGFQVVLCICKRKRWTLILCTLHVPHIGGRAGATGGGDGVTDEFGRTTKRARQD